MKRSALLWVAAVAALAGCGAPSEPADEEPELVHVHGLGVNPADRALYIATHSGLFRLKDDERKPRRVGKRRQDTMGFTVVGPDRFLGSGHPGVGDGNLPAFLGLIRSNDAGASWTPVSLLGKTDFHVLEAAGKHVYGFGSDFKSRSARFLVSTDGGRHWARRSVPEPLVSLAIDPEDPQHVVATGEKGAFSSQDEGRTWQPLDGRGGFLAWRVPNALHSLALDGSAARSADGGRTWTDTAPVGGEPAAFEAAGDTLYVALHDGTVKQSQDEGKTWAVRYEP